MKKIVIINGPNLNMLGIRDPEIYGHETYTDMVNMIKDHCKDNTEVDFYQSNHEGAIIDKIQELYKKADGIVINPGGYSHTSIAILDALTSVSIPYVEIHISDISQRESYRHISITGKNAIATVKGEGLSGYNKAVDILLNHIDK